MNNKTCILIIYSLLFCTSLFAQKQKISITADNQPIKAVFEQIQAKSEYYILYSDEVIPDSMKVSVQADHLPVSEILNTILGNKGLSCSLTHKGLIVISASAPERRKNSPGATPLRPQIFGNVSDQKNNALAFASVALLQEGRQFAGTMTDEKGSFSLSCNLLEDQKYTIKVSSVGYQTFMHDFVYPDTGFMHRVILTEEKNTLKTVVVTARRPLVVRKADRYVIDVENSFLANGNSGLDVLQKSPGIWVDHNGSIRIKGNQPVAVMINDVFQRMSSEELAEYLKTLKSEAISKIEVISNPPSEFEASGSGGIIHIILKKAREDGFVGSIFGRYQQQGEKPAAGGGISLDYKVKNLYLFGSAFYTKEKSYYLATTDIVYPDKSLYYSSTDRNNNNDRRQYRLGIAYDLSRTQYIGLQTVGADSKLLQSFITGIDYINSGSTTSGISDSYWIRNPGLTSSTLNYLWRIDSAGSSLKVIADYTGSNKTETNNFSAAYNDPLKDAVYRTNTPNNTNIYSFQSDYTKVLKNKTEIKGGVKFASTKRDNELINEDFTANEWVLDPSISNRFIYNEKLLMGYMSFERTVNKTSIKMGVRAEETYVRGNSLTSGRQFSKKYFGLFPSVFINRNINEARANAVHLSYSRRLQRPAFNELNPYRLQFDTYMVKIGNPDLLPQYTHNMEFGYDFKKGYSADVFFSSTSNTIGELANPVSNNVIEYQSQNFNNSSDYGFSFNAPVSLAPWWTTNTNLSFHHFNYTINNFNNDQTSFFAKSSQTINIKKIFDLDTYAEYRSPYVRGNSRLAHVFYFDMGFSRKILNKKVRLSLYFTDIFNTFHEQDVTAYNNTRIDFYQKRPTRTAIFSFNYSFSSGKKFTNKKIDQSNNEERNRIGN